METKKLNDNHISEIIHLENRLKDFGTIVYKIAQSVTQIEMTTLRPNSDVTKIFALEYNHPRFQHTTLKKTQKLYSAACLFDPYMHLIVYDCEE